MRSRPPGRACGRSTSSPGRPISAEIELVRAEAEVVYRGRRQATAQAKLVGPATGKLLAHATSTCMIIAP